MLCADSSSKEEQILIRHHLKKKKQKYEHGGYFEIKINIFMDRAHEPLHLDD
jgi:hypothetical protein